MIQARLLAFREFERGDAGAGFLLAEREWIIGAEHHVIGAGDIEQVAQRARIVHARVEPEALEIIARIARVVGGDQVRTHANAVLNAADGVREGTAAVSEADAQLWQALRPIAKDQAARRTVP